MKKIFRTLSFAAMAAAMTLSLASCNEDGPVVDPDDEKNEAFEALANQFVDNTVNPTYKALADYSETLVDNLKALKSSKTQANVNAACETFLEARAWWEMSEAFLFGAATDFGIDPHIDSWPLDLDGLKDELGNASHIAAMEADDADIWAGAKLGPELLGFHGIEYIIFADGEPKAVANISDDELTYAVAVAGDLRNKCFQLQVSWAGSATNPSSRISTVEGDLELNTTVNSGSYYGENMKNASQAGSTYSSWTTAAQAIVDGCMTIVDEVGTQKIGQAYNGEDIHYIESPYSHMSITDFRDNMISVQNVYMGGVEGSRDESKSLHGYLQTANAELDARCIAAIENAIEKITAMKAPFVLYYTDPSCGTAIDACTALNEVLTEVKAELAK